MLMTDIRKQQCCIQKCICTFLRRMNIIWHDVIFRWTSVTMAIALHATCTADMYEKLPGCAFLGNPRSYSLPVQQFPKLSDKSVAEQYRSFFVSISLQVLLFFRIYKHKRRM